MKTTVAAALIVIDAGVEHLRVRVQAGDGRVLSDTTVPNHADLRRVFEDQGLVRLASGHARPRVRATGRLAATAQRALGRGRVVQPAAALWLSAKQRMARAPVGVSRLALLDLSASGYLLAGVDRRGDLSQDLLVVNPRCGAGSGVNLDRVLQKLAVPRHHVDALLNDYSGDTGQLARSRISTRADRCGVFASSATVSDKNQGIPLDVALATTLKSEVLKACRKLPPGFDAVCFSGRIFHWRFARDCAEDYVRQQGVRVIDWDPDNTQVLDALAALDPDEGDESPALSRTSGARSRELPGFVEIRKRYEADGRYLRLPDAPPPVLQPGELGRRLVVVGLDVGSTMAKAVVADGETGEPLFLSASSNAGDTIETVKRVWREIIGTGAAALEVRGIGITGSARYQVQQALARIYPALAARMHILVENYAHARGSIDEARRHVARLSAAGVDVNRDLCVLVDIGGEDTKVSTVALAEAELFANAMNLKCSAGTGSLMDTLTALFGERDVSSACAAANAAPHALAIDATCAVFLMEHARRLQAEGVPRDRILASANWAIVENMARTLWAQIDLPPRAVVLLHGQTMLSDPLPLAVTDRLQSYLRAPAYALVPPHPGHRACFGLVRTMLQVAPGGGVVIELRDLVEAEFDKKIIECRGAACGDAAARCNRTSLACQGADGHRFTFTLGGCTAVNELFARRGAPPAAPVRDAYKEIWDFLASHQPRSDAANRLVIPRSFCVSEWAFLFARTFERFGIPVHVDEVREADLLSAQTVFLTDTCAPHMGAVGQYRRLAGEPHGMILAPQIEDLPTDGVSLGLACTVNQGGVAVACNLAKLAHPAARFHQFSVQLAHLDAAALADQLEPRLRSVFAHYGLTPTGEALRAALEGAIEDHCQLRRQAADLAADLAEEALAEGRPVAIVAGREYVLNPGLYDSSVRRLLRDKRMAAIPSYVLDVTLDAGFSHIYWRNPHAIVTILSAIADRTLHARIGHPRLAAIFRRIEQQDPPGPLVPVVQVSTFSCGPDSVTAPLVAEIMRRRPFLLLQSDAVLKELAHLENRVNTYVKQLELGLQGQLRFGDAPPIEVRRMGPREAQAPIDRDHDVVYVPTVGDNRVVTSVLRAAGITCIDNWDESLDLKDLVREGRRVTGDAVCAPLAAVYGDLLRAVEDFGRRAAAGDPLVRGKCRLLYFDNQGDGPCRQGQYAGVHELLMRQSFGASKRPGDPSSAGRLPGGAMLQLAVGRECNGFDFGLEEWALVRAYQGTVLQGVLQDLLFAGGSRCRDAEEFEQLRADHRALKDELYGELERFTGPGAIGRRVTAASRRHPLTNLAAKFFAYRLHGRDLGRPVARFARRWIHARELPTDRLRIHVSGEVYMRVAQAEPLFTRLLAIAGFGRFEMTLSPLWSYLEYLPEERIEHGRERLEALHAAAAREGRPRADAAGLARVRREVREARMMGAMLRNVIARPLYRAAGLPLPPSPRELLETAREVLPTLRPHGELALYVGEVLEELRSGVDVFLSVAPAGCMVTSMGEVLTPVLSRVAGGLGRIQSLFSADGDLNEDLLALSLLKAVGPERFSAFGHVSSRLEIAPAAAR